MKCKLHDPGLFGPGSSLYTGNQRSNLKNVALGNGVRYNKTICSRMGMEKYVLLHRYRANKKRKHLKEKEIEGLNEWKKTGKIRLVLF